MALTEQDLKDEYLLRLDARETSIKKIRSMKDEIEILQEKIRAQGVTPVPDPFEQEEISPRPAARRSMAKGKAKSKAGSTPFKRRSRSRGNFIHSNPLEPMTVIGKRPSAATKLAEPNTASSSFRARPEYQLWEEIACNSEDVILSSERPTTLVFHVPQTMLDEKEHISGIEKMTKTKITVLPTGSGADTAQNERQVKIEGSLMAIHTAHILAQKIIIEIQNRPKPNAFTTYPEAFNFWKLLVPNTENCLNQEVCIEVAVTQDGLAKFKREMKSLQESIKEKTQCEVDLVEEGELAIGVTGPCIGVHAAHIMVLDAVREDGPRPAGEGGDAKPLSGGVFDSNPLVQVYSDAARDADLSVLSDMTMTLFVPAETYNVLKPHNLTEDVQERTKSKLTWEEEEQGCRQLTIQGSAFGVHASHFLIVQTICDSSE